MSAINPLLSALYKKNILSETEKFKCFWHARTLVHFWLRQELKESWCLSVPSMTSCLEHSLTIEEIFKLFSALFQLIISSLSWGMSIVNKSKSIWGELKMAPVMHVKKSSKIKCKNKLKFTWRISKLKLWL